MVIKKASPRKVRLRGDVQRAYLLIAGRRLATPALARALGVSTATAFRLVGRLRKMGVRIVSVKDGRSWYFELRDEIDEAWREDPLLKLVGTLRDTKRLRGESVDDAVYGRRAR